MLFHRQGAQNSSTAALLLRVRYWWHIPNIHLLTENAPLARACNLQNRRIAGHSQPVPL